MMAYMDEEEEGIDVATGLEPGCLGDQMGHETGLQRQKGKVEVGEEEEKSRNRESWNPIGGSLIRLALRDVL